MGLATELETGINGFLATFVSNTSSQLSSDIIPLALTGATIWVILYGYAVMRGAVHDSLHTFLSHAIKISLIAGVALSAGEYQGSIVGFVEGLQSALINAISGSASVGAAIDNMSAPFEALEKHLYGEAFTGTIPTFSIAIAAIIITIAKIVVIVGTIGLFMIAKILLCFVLAVGPIFIACAMFSGTQRFTESWVGSALGLVLLNTFVAGSIAMVTSFAEAFATQISANADTANLIAATTNLLIVSVALIGASQKLDSLAAQLTGSVAFGGLNLPKLPPKKASDKAPPAPKNEIKNDQGGSTENKAPTNVDGRNGGSNRGYGSSGSGNPAAAPLYQRSTVDFIRKASTR